MRLVLTALLALMLPFAANAQEREIQRADNAVRVLSEILAIPEESIPERLLREAEAIAVMPDVVKAGLVFGGRGGKGLMAVRGSDGTWSNPTFITLGGGSFGFQAGVQSADVVLVFRNRRGVDNIVNGKFTLGADASVAAGPVGRSAQASTRGWGVASCSTPACARPRPGNGCRLRGSAQAPSQACRAGRSMASSCGPRSASSCAAQGLQ